MYNEEIKCMSVSLQDFNDHHFIQDSKCLLSYFSFKNEIKLAKNKYAFYFICQCTSRPV